VNGPPDPLLTDGPGADPSQWVTEVRDDTRLPTLMTLYLREVRRYERLSPEREFEVLSAIADGEDGARDTLICHHLGLVIAMARAFSHRGLDLLDLIGEGNLGMLVALSKFDAERGLRFSTYAGWWIRYYLQTAIATQVPIVRPPLRAQQRAGREAWQHWVDAHDAEAGDFSDSAPAPLVTQVAIDGDDTEAQLALAGHMEADVFDDVAERHDAPRLARLLHELVARLPVRQRDVIVARFGLDGSEELTLQQLSALGGVTRERIRQVQVAALQALREGLEAAGITRDIALA
jgi:RNA polymerase sigma factor (sigma-70 family)